MIDLNADLGEGFGDDATMLKIVTSASIACGGHAGGAETMRETICGARANGVRIGAHPGFRDREHFGRRRLNLAPAEICAQVLDQIAILDAIGKAQGVRIGYMKLHGALANMAAEDDTLSHAIFSAVAESHPGLAILALAGSAHERAARALDLDVIAEAYADRAYTRDGLLVSRTRPGAMITDIEAVVARCVRLAERGEIEAMDGTVIKTSARSICVHGDTKGAVDIARAIRTALTERDLLDRRNA